VATEVATVERNNGSNNSGNNDNHKDNKAKQINIGLEKNVENIIMPVLFYARMNDVI
jgi:hypothetical protein